MTTDNNLRQGQSCAPEARAAVAEFHAQVTQPDMAAVLFFCSSAYDLDALADEFNRRFPGVPVVGCTTAGEIGPAGYREHSLSGVSFSASAFAAEIGLVSGLSHFDMATGRTMAEALQQSLEARQPRGHQFAMLLIDGLSMREEPVAHALQDGLGAVPLFGGSAGDDLHFLRTRIFQGGQFHDDSAVLLLLSTPLPFVLVRTQHFVAEDERLVVTEVDAAQRLVKEINGLPAVDEYARLVGISATDLAPGHFAKWPVVVMIDGTDYVRSIQHANPDGSLTFYCAIDEGVVLRVAHGVDMVEKTSQALQQVADELGGISSMLVCDCILRQLEAVRTGSRDALGDLFRRYHAVGFSTYGEQLGGIHINQTLTGIAFGVAGGDHGH